MIFSSSLFNAFFFWGFSFTYFFFVGGKGCEDGTIETDICKQIEEEVDVFMIPGLQDGYQQLPAKTAALLRLTPFLSFDFLLKVDDDMFVNVPNLIEQLTSLPTTKLFWGFTWK
jgi:hypothetical protein